MSRGLKTSAKAGAAVATVTRMESRSEGQLMKIELRRLAGVAPPPRRAGRAERLRGDGVWSRERQDGCRTPRASGRGLEPTAFSGIKT
ncbi:unnamed protein product, partial [Gadus morhua 'NCC']